MSFVSSSQSNPFNPYFLDVQDSVFSLPASRPIVPVETVASVRENAWRRLDKDSILCPALLNADIFVYTEPNPICSCLSNSQDPSFSPHNERSLTPAVREMIVSVRMVAERALKKAFPDSIIPGYLSLNEINTEASPSSSQAKKSPPRKKRKIGTLKKKQPGILKRKQPKTVQKKQSVPLQKTHTLSAPLLSGGGRLTDEEFKVIKEIKGRKGYFEKDFRDTLDAIFYKFSTDPIYTWKEVQDKFSTIVLPRIKDCYKRWNYAGLFTQMATVLNKPELNRLIENSNAAKLQDNFKSLQLPLDFRILTDEEWNLIEPFTANLNRSRYSNRDCFDGILHAYASEKSFPGLINKNIKSSEYRFRQRITIQYDVWKRKKVFTAIQKELVEKNLFVELQKKLDILINHPYEKSNLPPDFDIIADDEWNLIKPLLKGRLNSEYSNRDCLNGILHKYAGDHSFWTLIKKRLGNDELNFQQRVRLRYVKWNQSGFFSAAYEELAKSRRFPELQKKLEILIKRSCEEWKLPAGFSVITDEEWGLIEPFITNFNFSTHYSNRDCFNGILHKYAGNAADWNLLKEKIRDPRFNFQRRIRAQYDNWKRSKVFTKAYNELVKNELSPALQKKLDILIKSPSEESELTSRLNIVTDEEWGLIKPFVIESPERKYSSRDCFNGILHKYAGKEAVWDIIRNRLGDDRFRFQKRITKQYQSWKESGFFKTVRSELIEKKVFPELRRKLDILINEFSDKKSNSGEHVTNSDRQIPGYVGSNALSIAALLTLPEIDDGMSELDSLAQDSNNKEANLLKTAEESACIPTYVESSAPSSPQLLFFPEITTGFF